MTNEVLTILISAITSILVSFVILTLTIKKEDLVQDINRDLKLLEEAYGPLIGYIERIGTPRFLDGEMASILSMKPEIIESIISLRNRFGYEFSKELTGMIDYMLIKSEGPNRTLYKEKIQQINDNSPLRVERSLKVKLKEFPESISNGEEFKRELKNLVVGRFEELKNSHEDSLKIKKSIFKLILWSLIGYRGPFSKKTT